MGALNRVISGAFNNERVTLNSREAGISIGSIRLNKTSVKQYEVVSNTQGGSASGAVVRGALGMAFLGPIGLLAAAGGQGTHIVAIEFYSGLKSLIEINDVLYKEFLAIMFDSSPSDTPTHTGEKPLVAQLEEFKTMLDEGEITQEEYSNKSQEAMLKYLRE